MYDKSITVEDVKKNVREGYQLSSDDQDIFFFVDLNKITDFAFIDI